MRWAERSVRAIRPSVPDHIHTQLRRGPGSLVNVRKLSGELESHSLDDRRNLCDPFPIPAVLLGPPVRTVDRSGAFQGFNQVYTQTGFAKRGSSAFQIGAGLHFGQLVIDVLHVSV